MDVRVVEDAHEKTHHAEERVVEKFFHECSIEASGKKLQP